MDADAATCSPVTHYTPLMAKRPIDVALGLSGSRELYGTPEVARNNQDLWIGVSRDVLITTL